MPDERDNGRAGDLATGNADVHDIERALDRAITREHGARLEGADVVPADSPRDRLGVRRAVGDRRAARDRERFDAIRDDQQSDTSRAEQLAAVDAFLIDVSVVLMRLLIVMGLALLSYTTVHALLSFTRTEWEPPQ